VTFSLHKTTAQWHITHAPWLFYDCDVRFGYKKVWNQNIWTMDTLKIVTWTWLNLNTLNLARQNFRF